MKILPGALTYLWAALATGVAIVIRWLLDPFLAEWLPLSVIYAAVVFSVWVGGWRPAAFAAIVGTAACTYLFVDPRGSFVFLTGSDIARSLTFLALCSVIIVFGERMRLEQRRTAAALEATRESERKSANLAKRVTLITDAIPALISYVNAEQRYVFNNKAYEDWHGVSREQIHGKHIRELLGEEAYNKFKSYIEGALSGRSVDVDGSIPLLQGGARPIHVRYVPDVQPDGTVAGFYVLATDLTERRRAETQLRESEERFRTLADSAPALIWVNLPDGTEFANRECAEFFGVDASELLGLSWARYLHPDDREEYLNIIHRAVEQGAPFDSEVRFRRYDGKYRWMRSIARPRFAADGRCYGHSGLTVDITERKQAVARMLESEKSAAVGNLAAGLSHDMANLVMPLQTALNMLSKAALADQRAKEAIELASRSAAALVDLIKGMRQLVPSADQSAKPCTIDLADWWQRSERLLRASIPVRNVVTGDFEKGPLLIQANEGDLMRAVLNLVVNASDAITGANIQDGRILVWAKRSEGGATVELGITDNGPGIPDELKEKIFEPFFSTKKSGFATGMGMSIIKDFVERAGGSMTLNTSVGLGTRIVMRRRLQRSQRASLSLTHRRHSLLQIDSMQTSWSNLTERSSDDWSFESTT